MTLKSESPKMDPWLLDENSINLKVSSTFEDNFKPVIDHLPDSMQYLATLESKLKKIKSDPNILKQLVAQKEACLRELINSETFEIDAYLEIPINYSSIARNIAPERTAVNQGEIISLIKHDQLAEEQKNV